MQGKAILCQLLLARIHLDSGRPERARSICTDALGKLEQAESPALSYQGYFVSRLDRGGAWEPRGGAPGVPHGASVTWRACAADLRGEETKIAFLKDKLEVYEALVRMCIAGPDTEENRQAAFVYIEQAKSRSLADLIAFRAQELPPSPDTHRALVEQVRTLREELNWYSRALQLQESRSKDPRDARTEKLRRNARECEHRLVEAMADLRVEDREFANLQGAGSIDLDAIRAALPDDAMLLQYYRVRDTFHACLLTRKSLKIAAIGVGFGVAAVAATAAFPTLEIPAWAGITSRRFKRNCWRRQTRICRSSIVSSSRRSRRI